MAQDTQDLRTKTRRVKNHILTRFLAIADKYDASKEVNAVEAKLYDDLLLTFARNVIPRSMEHGGDADNETPIPILSIPMNVPANNSNQQNSPASEKDQGDTGGNVS